MIKIFTLLLINGLIFTIVPGYAMNLEGNTDLLRKNFMKASFRGSNLRNADLMGQNLSEVDFRDTDISGSNLIGTILANAKMNSNTKFSGARGWAGTIQIKAGKEMLNLHALSGEEISVTKEWLIGQGVIFQD